MSATKKAKKKDVASMNAYEKYFHNMDLVQAKNKDILGPMIIRGLNSPNDDNGYDDDEEDDEKDQDTSKYTEQQMATLRYVFITQKRSDRLDEMRQFILGEQANQSFMMFNTSFSYQVLDGFDDFKSTLYAKAKTAADKFDLLFAFTYNLKEFDTWMHDNEGGMDGMVKALASMWKRLLKSDDEKLGIDAEYTRPGITQFLEDFKEQVEDMEVGDDDPIVFNFE